VSSLKDLFLLDPTVTFLNHGSFGACPIPVFETYQRWQRELERQPVEFFQHRADPLLDDARARLAACFNTPPDRLIFVPNATVGINQVARAVRLQPGDQILTTDHEYGAMDYTWNFICGRTGARYIRHSIPVPVTTPQALADSFWSAVTPATRVIFLSHMTSPTALIFPVGEICRRARAAGILTIIDGAHVPGHLPLDLTALDADIYTGNCHKWLCAPRGSAFLYARPEHHAWLEPLVISWGWVQGASFAQQNQWQGTRDLAAYLAVPAAIDFQAEHDWPTVRQRGHALAREARAVLTAWSGLEPLSPDSHLWFAQMITLPLPACDPTVLKTRLYDEFRVEAPIVTWNNRPYIRLSFQAYNTAADLDRLMTALHSLFP
jgi:isopenicillin-N epimerase